MRIDLVQAIKRHAQETPAVAMEMSSKKIIARWASGVGTHWVVGTTQVIDGVSYILRSITETRNLNYLLCERR